MSVRADRCSVAPGPRAVCGNCDRGSLRTKVSEVRRPQRVGLLFAVRANDTGLLYHLIDACSRNQQELEAEASDGHNALTKACEDANLEHIEILWRCGVNVNKETARGRTALNRSGKERPPGRL